MDKFIGALTALAVVGVSFWAMARSWRRRTVRDSGVQLARSLPPGTPIWAGSVQYVASAAADERLNRLALPGLAFRGPAIVTVTDAGILLEVAGERPVAIARNRLTAVAQSSWAVDRGIGTDGLVDVEWVSDGNEPRAIVTSLRPTSETDHRSLLTALETLTTLESA